MDELEPLLVDFTRRLREEECPSIEDYCRLHPHLETLIRELFPTVEALETHKREPSTTAPNRSSGREALRGAHASRGEVTSLLHPPDNLDEIGRLGGYRIREVLGQGGMGAVLRAEDPRLARQVALKVMLPLMARNPAAVTRFNREARAVATLKHPRIVSIYQIGEDQGLPFLVMELLQGESLEERLRRDGPLPTADILRIGREAAEGLAAAHDRGLIHRDIKPANVFLEGPEGSVKLLDFGLVCADADDVDLTQTGLTVGTPTYMSPEQANDGDVDPRSDLFSLGVVLYRMCTGELPFKGRSSIGVLSALALHTPAPPCQVNPHVPAPLSDLIMRLLAKQPADRIGSAQEVAAILQTLATGEHVALPPPRSAVRARRLSRRWLPASALVVAAVVAFAWRARVDWARPHAAAVRPTVTAPPPQAAAPFDAAQARLHQERWAAYLNVPLEITATNGLKTRLVPPGTFSMGPGPDGTAAPGEGSSHDVSIRQPFYVGIHEVTVGQFRAFVSATGYETEAERLGTSDRHVPPAGEFWRGPVTWREPGFAQTDAHPVVHVSWNDACAFCQWLTQREGYVYRLLSEAEWEYCCRAGTTTRFYWGDDDEGFEGCANFADAAYRRVFSTTQHPTLRGDDGHAFTAPVGGFGGNAFGLYDMHGNVWEWVEEPFVSNDANAAAQEHKHILRGGSWVTTAWYGRASFRDIGSLASARYDHVGFRVARAVRPVVD